MKIKETSDWSRRDFLAVYECEHCGHLLRAGGYDDSNFYNNVVPSMVCPVCEKDGKHSAEHVTPRHDPHTVM